MSDRSPTAGELALYERACELRERAYAPYSEFPVGAVLLAEDGRTFEGVNVENGSIGLTICAERSACVRAVSEGARRFTAIGVSTHDSAHTGSPCGACRQFLSEFGLDSPSRLPPRGRGRRRAAVRAPAGRLRTAGLTVRSGFVGLAGRPNVGKSTLTNALCGAHVAIVSDKPQTTRQRALGVVHGDDWQIVLVDLPGFQKPFDALTRRMQRSVDDSLRDVDAVLLVLDASEFSGGGDRFIAEQLVGHRRARRDRAQQGRPPQARRHRRGDHGGLRADRLRRAASRSARARETACPSSPSRAREAAARGAAVLRAGRRLRPAARAAHRRAGARAGARAHARGGAARDRRRRRRDQGRRAASTPGASPPR